MMRIKSRCIPLLLYLLFFCGCENSADSKKSHQQVEYIERLHHQKKWTPLAPQKKAMPRYAWETEIPAPFPNITKEYFRCRGSVMNPTRYIHKSHALERLEDCGGSTSHSLPLKNGKEFIYPILIDLMNYLQKTTRHKVVITSGHRCPKHHQYARIDGQSLHSKHMLGAETSFYVQGFEHEPEKIVELLMNYYQNPKYTNEYTDFQRYMRDDVDVSTLPWYNKEIYIKLYLEGEGRDFDNRHPYPYIRIQVRYDRDEDKRVLFNWDLAEKNYLRL
jgi:hypothetical protein